MQIEGETERVQTLSSAKTDYIASRVDDCILEEVWNTGGMTPVRVIISVKKYVR